MPRPCSLISPKSVSTSKEEKRGKGVLAVDTILAGEVVAIFGGAVYDGQAYRRLSPEQARLGIQVDEDHFLVSRVEGAGDWVNHSCEPNLGLRGQIVLVALRDIEAGEELCFDYAMSDGCDYDAFECRCGAKRCRGQVTGNDWRNPSLWKRYEGYFSPYLARRIARLRWGEVADDWTPYSEVRSQ